jgi:hypothetical protein
MRRFLVCIDNEDRFELSLGKVYELTQEKLFNSHNIDKGRGFSVLECPDQNYFPERFIEISETIVGSKLFLCIQKYL